MRVVVRGVTKQFASTALEVRALGGINLEVRDREFFGIGILRDQLGESGRKPVRLLPQRERHRNRTLVGRGGLQIRPADVQS